MMQRLRDMGNMSFLVLMSVVMLVALMLINAALTPRFTVFTNKCNDAGGVVIHTETKLICIQKSAIIEVK